MNTAMREFFQALPTNSRRLYYRVVDPGGCQIYFPALNHEHGKRMQARLAVLLAEQFDGDEPPRAA